MPIITLPDGSCREYDTPISVLKIAESIGAGLAKATLAAKIDGELFDACDVIDSNSALQIITPKDPEGLEIIRHSCAHLLGQAVKQLYPDAQMTIGPVVAEGFYYDIALEHSLNIDDLQKIEERMAELIAHKYDVIKKITQRDEARRIFEERNERYKVMLIDEMPAEITQLGLYYHEEYIDMCRGPHVPNSQFLSAFKLLRISGAYWRGDAKNEVLQRIYGTAYADSKALKKYLQQREEAEKRDHRKIGAQLNLFHFRPESPGMVFWHENGWTLYRLIEDYMRTVIADDYREVHTPQMLDQGLWEESGHWDKFGSMIFVTESEKRHYAIKPMNCPGHVQIYKQSLRSHNDLPIRIAEFGVVHRNEPSGTLHGLMRARRFTQDDGHIFCQESQLAEEISYLLKQIYRVYADFGFEDILVNLSTRPVERVGTDAQWDDSEKVLADILSSNGFDYKLCSGEGAFYGPKIEFVLRDSIGRDWQCGTVQLDFSMPERLGAEFVGADSARHTPVMIHRAVLGSLERFIGILIEHYAGVLPFWLAPIQINVLSITERNEEYAQKIKNILRTQGFRAKSDVRNETINLKIRENSLQKIPYLLIVGDREQQSEQVAVRTVDGKDLGAMPFTNFVKIITNKTSPSSVKSSSV